MGTYAVHWVWRKGGTLLIWPSLSISAHKFPFASVSTLSLANSSIPCWSNSCHLCWNARNCEHPFEIVKYTLFMPFVWKMLAETKLLIKNSCQLVLILGKNFTKNCHTSCKTFWLTKVKNFISKFFRREILIWNQSRRSLVRKWLWIMTRNRFFTILGNNSRGTGSYFCCSALTGCQHFSIMNHIFTISCAEKNIRRFFYKAYLYLWKIAYIGKREFSY